MNNIQKPHFKNKQIKELINLLLNIKKYLIVIKIQEKIPTYQTKEIYFKDSMLYS